MKIAYRNSLTSFGVPCLSVTSFLHVGGVRFCFLPRCLHVSLHYFKPWRPTFLELLPDEADERRLKGLTQSAEEQGAPQYVTCGMMQRDQSTLSFLSHMQLVSSLDMTLQLDSSCWTPLFCVGVSSQQFWQGAHLTRAGEPCSLDWRTAASSKGTGQACCW